MSQSEEPADPAGGDKEPSEADQLLRYAEDLKRLHGERRVLSRQLGRRAPWRRKVLIVDDEQSIRLLLGATLDADEYEVIEAENGAQALALAEAEQPALIILDVHMPDMDGTQVCQRIRAHETLGNVPIIMVTAAHGEEAKQAGLRAGADRYLTKPFSPAELLDAIDQLLRGPTARRPG